MLPLTGNEKVLYANEKQCYICEKSSVMIKTVQTTKINVKLETIAILPVTMVVLLIVYVI